MRMRDDCHPVRAYDLRRLLTSLERGSLEMCVNECGEQCCIMEYGRVMDLCYPF